MNRLSVMALAAVALAGVSCGHKAQRGAEAQVPDIEVARVVMDTVTLYKKFPGTLSAMASVGVVARVNGTLTGKYYDSGDFVHKGQLLFTIESTAYDDAVRQAEAALVTARSQNEYAAKHLEAVEKAYRSDAVSQMELEQARNDRRTAEASVKNAQAALSTARMRQGYCRVTAPISGRVTDNILSAGNYVSGEASPVKLCDIYDISEVVADFAVEDAAIALGVAANLPGKEGTVPVHFTQPMKHSYTASYYYVAPDMNNSTGTLPVKLTIKNPYGELLPGMYVDVSLPVGIDSAAILVRDASLSTDQLGKYLYTVNDSNKVVYTPVQTGDMDGDSMRIITSGLRPGARYVTSALLKVRDGMTVNPIEISK